MTTFFTADHHFGHANIIEYVDRPFSSVETMDEVMITRWNDRVGPSDVVYHLGDFTLQEHGLRYYERLNGSIKFIPGGHDYWLKNWLPYGRFDVLSPLYEYKSNSQVPQVKVHITLCHYPMLSWNRSHYGALHFHGHTHGTIGVISPSGDKQLPPEEVNGIRVDVGVDNWDFYPVTLQEILDEIEVLSLS